MKGAHYHLMTSLSKRHGLNLIVRKFQANQNQGTIYKGPGVFKNPKITIHDKGQTFQTEGD